MKINIDGFETETPVQVQVKIFFASRTSSKILKAKAALELIRKTPGLTNAELFKQLGHGIGCVPRGYISCKQDKTTKEYRYYPK